MSRGDGQHGYGHSQYCHWCGVDGDSPEADRPCDEREHQKPTAEESAAFDAQYKLAEEVSAIASDFGIGLIGWEEMMCRIEALKP